MAVTVTISGIPYMVMEGTPSCDDTQDGRSVATFNVKDLTGTVHFQPGQPVVLTDTTNNYTYTGNINDSQETPLPPSACIISTINCIDGHYYPDKRYYSGPEYQNMYAGDIATDLISRVLASEGITAAFAVDTDQSYSDWQQGTQNGTTAATNLIGGDLELAAAGTPVTFLQQSQSSFNAGTTGGGLSSPASGGVTFTPTQAIAFKASNTVPGNSNAYMYVKIWQGGSPYTIQASDILHYDVWIADSCPANNQMSAVDFVLSSGEAFRDSISINGVDLQGQGMHPMVDLTGLATNQWYSRRFFIDGGSSWVGKTIQYVTVAFEGNATGNYTSYFRNIYIDNGGSVQKTFFSTTATATQVQPQIMQDNGYSNMSCIVATSYERHGFMYSPAFLLTNAGIANTSLLNWAFTPPIDPTTLVASTKFTLTVTASLDGFATFLPCTLNSPIPGLLAGQNLSGINLYLAYVFDNSGNDPTLTPLLAYVEGSVTPSYACSKSDSVTTKDTQSQYNAGTLSGLTAPGGNVLQLNGYARNWDNADYSNQTQYGTSSPVQGIQNRGFYLQSGTSSTDVRSRLDFAGQWRNFTAEVDINVQANITVGMVYRTTGWQNNNDTYAYEVDVSTTRLTFGYGTNSSSGSGTHTTIGTPVSLSLSSGNVHRLKVVVNSSDGSHTTHNIYLDDVLYITSTDNTYNATGYIGLRMYNPSGATQTGYFDNFGVVANLSGTYVSTAINISSLSTISNSEIVLQIDPTVNFTICTFLVEISLNNGSTWTTCTNSQTTGYYYTNPVPGLTSGTNVSGMTQVKIRITITTSTAATGLTMPDITAVTLTVLGAYSSSGNRVSDALSLAPVGRAGSTLVAWSGIQPLNTTIAVDTSLDAITWTQVGVSTPVSVGSTNIIGSASIANIVTQSTPTIDNFNTNTSSNYTSTFQTGGALASYTWDTALSRLEASGGTNAHLLYNSPVLGADVDLSFISDSCDSGGFVWRWTDQSDFYSLHVHDASNSGSPNSMQLYKVISNVRTQIGASIPISFTRGTPHTFRLTHVGINLTIYVDGNIVYTNGEPSITASGFTGLRTDSSSGTNTRFYLFRQQYYGQDVSMVNVYNRIRLTSTDPTMTPQVANLSISARDSNIQNGAFIAQTSYSILNGNKTYISAIFDDLVKQSGNYWWRIKNNRFYFQQHQAIPAPWVLTGNDALINNLTIDNINDAYRNSQWMTNGLDTVYQQKSFTGNGTQTVFNVDYPIDSISSISIGAVTQSVGIKGVDTGKQWYYTQGQTAITGDASLIPMTNLQTLTVAYYGQVTINSNIQRPSEIARVAAIDNSTGIVDEAEDGKGLTKQALIAKGSGYLDTFAQPSKTATFDTLRSGLAVGQLVSIFNIMGIFMGSFLIVDLKTTWQSTNQNGVSVIQPWFSISCCSGPRVQAWSAFVHNLAGTY